MTSIETAMRYEQISPKAYEHPADRAATSALHAVPLLDTVIKRLVDMKYERRLTQMIMANSIQLGPEQLPEIWGYYVHAATVLDMPRVPDLFLYSAADMNAMTIGAKTPIVVVKSSLMTGFNVDEIQTILAHEASHVLSEHVYYTTAIIMLKEFLEGQLPKNLFIGLPVKALYYALLEWRRAAELSADRAAALVRGDPLDPCRVLMKLAGGGVPGLNFEAFLKQCTEYHGEDDLFTRHTRFWAELQLTHPVVVRRVKELIAWVQTGDYDRIRSGIYPRRGQEPPPSAEFDAAVAEYRARFARFLDRTVGDVQRVGRQLGDWLKSRAPGANSDDREEDPDGE